MLTKLVRSFGKNEKSLSSTVGISLLTEGCMRLGMAKMMIERPRPSLGS
jgi:hypothetical protein